MLEPGINRIMRMQLPASILPIFAIVAAMELIGAVAVEILSVPEDGEARGCNNSQAFNASQGRCFGH
jgi:hypothetical protein